MSSDASSDRLATRWPENGVDRPVLAPVPLQSAATARDTAALAELASRARRELALLNIPPAPWSLAVKAPGLGALPAAEPLDVLIAGAGMCGQTVAFALWREGLQRVRVVDARARGDEGPWGTYARMVTLRSPKHLTGPDLGVPSLTFRAWYEVQHGADAAGRHPSAPGWAGLHKVGRLDWRDYLLWVRDVLAQAGGPLVENEVRLVRIEALDAALLRVHLQGPCGPETVVTRKLVLALGREGSGRPRWPSFPSLSPVVSQKNQSAASIHHSADAIDFDSLRGRHVAVLGAGASAFDNAACALEAGARVSLFARRAQLPQINKNKWTTFPGFLLGYQSLDDDAKWRFYTYIFDEQVPPPWETVRRCDAHEHFELRLGCPWLDVRARDDGRVDVVINQPGAPVETYDAVIFGTGFDVDLLERPELDGWVDAIDTWAQHVGPRRAAAHPEFARFPYLGAGFELQAVPGTDQRRALALSQVHLFNWGSTLSHGALAGDIPGLAVGANRLAQHIVRDLFTADADAHWQRLQAHDEAELLNTRWYVAPDQRQP